MDPQTPKCDWCQTYFDHQGGVKVNDRWAFHDTPQKPCLAAYKRHTLAVKLETAKPLVIQPLI